MKAALLFAALGCAACSLPEDSNPAQRCDAEETCPDGLACYRGFCLGTDEVLVDDAGVVSGADAATSDARIQSVVTTDAALVVSQDVPSTPTATTTTTSAPAMESAPTPAPAAPVTQPTVLPCLSQCTDLSVNNACRDCVRTTFGGDPAKLCGSPAAQFSVALATICQLICTPDKNGSLKCDSSCNGKNCGGE